MVQTTDVAAGSKKALAKKLRREPTLEEGLHVQMSEDELNEGLRAGQRPSKR